MLQPNPYLNSLIETMTAPVTSAGHNQILRIHLPHCGPFATMSLFSDPASIFSLAGVTMQCGGGWQRFQAFCINLLTATPGYRP